MRLTTTIRFGVRALCDIAFDSGDTVTQARSISERQGIPARYLEQILRKLRKGGIVKTMRGPGGGYRLTRKPEDISVGDVIRAIDGRDIELVPCKGDGKSSGRACERYEGCMVSNVWTEGTRILIDYFNSISLADVCAEMRKREVEPGE